MATRRVGVSADPAPGAATYHLAVVATISAAAVLARLSPDERGWVTALRDQLRSRLGPRLRDLRLFGSKVRGDDHEESDIDILVLLDRRDEPTAGAIIDAAHAISPWLSLVIVDFERYHGPASRATGFYEELRRESVQL
jgi:predicted nucleotidyltransferase